MTKPSLPPDRAHLLTEQRNPSTMRLHELSVRECVDLIHEEDREVFRAMNLPAAKTGNVVRTGGKDLSWYGARSIEGLDSLRRVFDEARARRSSAGG